MDKGNSIIQLTENGNPIKYEVILRKSGMHGQLTKMCRLEQYI